ncbi:DUF1972 domain-containing protein [Emticicia sp. CRIBPO]|uniref:DUF1972 domain-containing protein n=1 Tax=Emticicia sp. CRIBPO TaxID=2683258 RepID=UPI001411C896|nr:DUF1972 domain-containing protein [Emticicia sp. CRIBPO]NBA87084.1 DUF1972 domain-containing protein [Emticicia sp. CRIBPO]
MKKKIGVVGTNGLPGRYGGWDQLLNHLTLNLRERFALTVYTSSHDAVKGLKEYNGAKLKIINLKANGYQSVFYDMVSLFHGAVKYDTLLVLGTSGCIFFPIVKLFGKKIILNPDGLEWNRGKWNKNIQNFLLLSEKIGIKYAHVIVADNVHIQKYISETYKRKSELIEYGGDNASFVKLSEKTKNKYSIEEGQYAFKVCRIEPENNIHLLLSAFSNSNTRLILIGNWNNSQYGKELRDQYSSYDNLTLLDPIYEQQTLDELRSNCGIYVHGHSVGGTNPSLVEAMTLGLCCIVLGVSYNIETTEGKALYFNDEEELGNLITAFERGEINTNLYRNIMKEIAGRRYRWSVITEKYAALF